MLSTAVEFIRFADCASRTFARPALCVIARKRGPSQIQEHTHQLSELGDGCQAASGVENEAPHAVASLPALGPWAPPAEWGPSLESIYRVFLTVDLCEGNQIISFKKLFYHSQLGAPQLKKKKNRALGTYPVCPLIKTALLS